MGRHWWAQRWSQLLGDTAAPERLHRGRALARGGSVFRFRIETGEARAEVRHSRTELHEVVIRHAPLSPEQWETAIEVLVSKAIYLGALLAGRLEEDLHEQLEQRGVEIFPSELVGMDMECSCTDPIAPCSHIAAVFYLVAERLDKDPFLLFRFRGRRRDLILADCRRLRSEHTLSAPKLGNDERDESELGSVNSAGLSTKQYFGDGDAIEQVGTEETPTDDGRPVLDELGPPPTVEPSSVSDQALREAYELGKSAAAGDRRVESPEDE